MKFTFANAILTILFYNCNSLVHGFANKLNKLFINKDALPSNKLIKFPKLEFADLTEKDKFELQWYVVGKHSDFSSNLPKQVKIWNTKYVVWKDKDGNYTSLHDACSHKGASLSNGKIINDNIACPYHGYEFNTNGTLIKVPGICFRNSEVHSVNKYPILEKNGWIYMNTMPLADILKVDTNSEFPVNGENIYSEPEIEQGCSMVNLNMDYNCYSRILSENSLDIMHIAFVHTFGNANRPDPVREMPPVLIAPNHYKSTYFYEAGEESLARRVFGVKDLVIENEFILPHTTIARVKFGDYVSTVMTFALPIGENKSRLFVKTYRNFWKNKLGDVFSRNTMYNTMLQDKVVVENIDSRFMDGNFNMRFDKLQNTYTSFYKRFVHQYGDGECDNGDCDL